MAKIAKSLSDASEGLLRISAIYDTAVRELRLLISDGPYVLMGDEKRSAEAALSALLHDPETKDMFRWLRGIFNRAERACKNANV